MHYFIESLHTTIPHLARHVESGIGIQSLLASRIYHCGEQNLLHKTHTQLTPTHMIGLIVLFSTRFFHTAQIRAPVLSVTEATPF